MFYKETLENISQKRTDNIKNDNLKKIDKFKLNENFKSKKLKILNYVNFNENNNISNYEIVNKKEETKIHKIEDIAKDENENSNILKYNDGSNQNNRIKTAINLDIRFINDQNYKIFDKLQINKNIDKKFNKKTNELIESELKEDNGYRYILEDNSNSNLKINNYKSSTFNSKNILSQSSLNLKEKFLEISKSRYSLNDEKKNPFKIDREVTAEFKFKKSSNSLILNHLNKNKEILMNEMSEHDDCYKESEIEEENNNFLEEFLNQKTEFQFIKKKEKTQEFKILTEIVENNTNYVESTNEIQKNKKYETIETITVNTELNNHIIDNFNRIDSYDNKELDVNNFLKNKIEINEIKNIHQKQLESMYETKILNLKPKKLKNNTKKNSKSVSLSSLILKEKNIEDKDLNKINRNYSINNNSLKFQNKLGNFEKSKVFSQLDKSSIIVSRKNSIEFLKHNNSNIEYLQNNRSIISSASSLFLPCNSGLSKTKYYSYIRKNTEHLDDYKKKYD